MFSFIREYKLIPAVVLLSLTALLLLFPKGDLVIALNGLHSPALDVFFKNITHLGDAIIVVPIIIYLWFTDKKAFLIFLIIFALQALIVLLFKQFLFYRWPRPRNFFEDELFFSLHHVKDVVIHHRNSFPSGHTLTAFSTALFFVWVRPVRKSLQILLIILAAIVGISRLYLLQHFLVDVFFSIILSILLILFIPKICEPLAQKFTGLFAKKNQ